LDGSGGTVSFAGEAVGGYFVGEEVVHHCFGAGIGEFEVVGVFALVVGMSFYFNGDGWVFP